MTLAGIVPAQAESVALPIFDVEITPPSLAAWRHGNTGVAGFWQFHGPHPGPHVMVTSLLHGNEIAGAIVLDRMLREGPRPACGTLTLGFANLDAFDRFDPGHPTASRYVDEDMNRLWDADQLDGPRHSVELARARAIRPLVETADIVLDLHSMLWPSEPLILCGPTRKGRALAASLGTPSLVVADHGHASGRRLIDYAPFVNPDSTKVAILVEAGQHWVKATIETAYACVAGLLASAGLGPLALRPVAPATRFAEVTMTVTAASGGFAFVRPYRGGDVVAKSDTLIAMDGTAEIRTPHDNCLLIMPSLRPSRGHTAVRLARFA